MQQVVPDKPDSFTSSLTASLQSESGVSTSNDDFADPLSLTFLPTIMEPQDDMSPHFERMVSPETSKREAHHARSNFDRDASPKHMFSTRKPGGRLADSKLSSEVELAHGEIEESESKDAPKAACPWSLLEKAALEHRQTREEEEEEEPDLRRPQPRRPSLTSIPKPDTHVPPPRGVFQRSPIRSRSPEVVPLPRSPPRSPVGILRTGSGGVPPLKCPVSGSNFPLGRTQSSSFRQSFKSGLGAGSISGSVSAAGSAGLKALQKFHDKAGSSYLGSHDGQSQVSGMSHRSGRRKGKHRASRPKHTLRPPNFSPDDVAMHAPRLKRSWKLFIERKSWRQLGVAVLEKLAESMPEAESMFLTGFELAGVKFIDMMNQIVEVVHDPNQVHGKMCALSDVHRARGVQLADVPKMTKALRAVLDEELKDDLPEPSREAWDWLCAFLNKSLALTLQDATSHSSLIQLSWEIALDNHSEEELGELVYETLLEIAPSMKNLITQPKQVVSNSFVEMLQTLVSLAGDEETMRAKMMGLSQRHHKYGVRVYHAPIMGQTIMAMLEASVGEEWTADMAAAWQAHWELCCATMNEDIVGWETNEDHASALWERVRRRISKQTFGEIVVSRLLKTAPDFVWTFTRAVKAQREEEEAASHSGEEADGAAPLDRSEEQGESAGGRGRRSSLAAMASHLTPSLSIFGKETCKCTHSGGAGGAGGAEPMHHVTMTPRALNLSGVGSPRDEDRGNGTPAFSPFGNQRGGGGKASRQDAAEVLGDELWSMIGRVVDILFQPKSQSVTCICCSGSMFSLATRLFHLGMRTAHLPDLSEAIAHALRSCLAEPCGECGLHEWKEEQSNAWAWLWGQWNATFRRVVLPLEGQEAQVVRAGWETVKASRSPAEIADAMYDNLVTEAPYTAVLFQRPKKMQEYSFTQALELIVQFGEQPDAFFKELQPLIIRHVKYGVKAAFLQPFGVALLKAMQGFLGDEWDAAAEAAWKGHWARCSGCVGRYLNIGTNLITVALVNADLSKLREALECAPRGQRVGWLTSVDVNGTVMSPLYWAIRDGKFNIGRYMLQDLLAIRADREAYYCGRVELWKTHPDLISVLCKEAPDLVEDLLDGLLWHSQTVNDGRVRVNYYIQELFSDPAETTDVWATPLAIITSHGTPAMFKHPVLIKVLDVKWAWMKRGFLLMQSLFAIQLLLFTVLFLHLEKVESPVLHGLRYFTLVFSSLMLLFFLKIIVQQVLRQQVLTRRVCGLRILLPHFLNSSWAIIRVLSMVLMIITASWPLARSATGEQRPSDSDASQHWHPHIKAWTGLLLWIQMAQALIISTRLAALLHSVRLLLSHVTRNLVLMGIVLFAFASYLASIEESEFESFEDSSLSLLRVVLQFDVPSYMDVGPWAFFMIVMFIIIIHIGMINIIIAQLALAYEDLSADKGAHAKMNRAFVSLEIESLLSCSLRRKLYEQQAFDKPLEFDNGDKGPAGGVQCLEPAAIRAHPKYVPDRIIRSTGRASALDPWPTEEQ